MPEAPPPSSAGLPRASLLTAAIGAAIVGSVLVAYLPALRAGFVWDDDQYLTQNPVVTNPAGPWRAWTSLSATPQFYPLVFSSFWIEHRLWGFQPVGYHLVNVVLHAGSTLLVWRILRRLGVPFAPFAAAIFGLHPVHVESVAWITERKNVLSAFLYLCSLAAYLRFAGVGPAEPSTPQAAPPPRPAGPRWPWYGLAILCFTGALLSKTVAATLPAAILLLLWWKRDRIRASDVVPLLPMFALGLVAGRITAWVEWNHVLAKDAGIGLTPVARLLVATRAPWFYFGKLVWPRPLIFVYERWRLDPGAWWQYLFALACLTVVVGLWLSRRRLGKGPLIAALYFGGTLVPALGLVDVYPMLYSWVADHFQYTASIGPIALFAAALAPLAGARRAGSPGWRPPLGAVVVSLGIVAALATATWNRCLAFRDAQSLWLDTLAKNESAWMAHNNLGAMLIQSGKPADGLSHIRRALELNPRSARAYNNLALYYLAAGDPRRALENARLAAALWPAGPQPLLIGARAALADGKPAESIDLATRAARLVPDLTAPHLIIAKARLVQDRPADAIEPLREALRLAPADNAARGALGLALALAGHNDEAEATCNAALAADPRSYQAQLGLAEVLARRGDTTAALERARTAAGFWPSAPEAYETAGRILAAIPDREEEAIAQFKRAAAASPPHKLPHLRLAALLSARGRHAEAAAHLKEVLTIDPADVEAARLFEAETALSH